MKAAKTYKAHITVIVDGRCVFDYPSDLSRQIAEEYAKWAWSGARELSITYMEAANETL